jgi:hypothetical protein
VPADPYLGRHVYLKQTLGECEEEKVVAQFLFIHQKREILSRSSGPPGMQRVGPGSKIWGIPPPVLRAIFDVWSFSAVYLRMFRKTTTASCFALA